MLADKKNAGHLRKAFVKPMKVVHCDKVRSVHRFSATGRQSSAMVDFLCSEKTQNGPFFAETLSKSIFSQKRPISNWILCTFLPNAYIYPYIPMHKFYVP